MTSAFYAVLTLFCPTPRYHSHVMNWMDICYQATITITLRQPPCHHFLGGHLFAVPSLRC